MNRMFTLALFILISIVLSSCSEPSSYRTLEIKDEKSGDLIGLDLTSINDLANKVTNSDFNSLSMNAMAVHNNKVNLNYTYRNKKGETVCFLSYGFNPTNNFSYLSISHADENCLEQAARISANKQIMGPLAEKLFYNLNKKHFDDYSITFMGKDKNNRDSYSIRKNK